jgi:hypothetical protein
MPMNSYPIPLFDVSTFTVDDQVSESELIEVQNRYVRPILGDALYNDFISDPSAVAYSTLNEFATECAKRWLYYTSLSKKMMFKDFLENSSESPGLLRSSITSALSLAQASSKALQLHVQSSAYALYVAPAKKTIAGFRIKNT